MPARYHRLMESLIKSRRQARGLSVRAAAKELGVTPGTWLRWEAGEIPGPGKRAQIEQLYGVTWGVVERSDT